jgi:uncharacterized DUF497 family protein
MRYHHFFEWDPRKSANHKAKHRVTFEDAAAVLRDPQAEIDHITAARKILKSALQSSRLSRRGCDFFGARVDFW